MRYLGFYILLIFLGFPSLSEECPNQTIQTVDQLVELVRNENCQIKSIDSLLSKLPVELRSKFSLVYRSQSLQGPHNKDYQNPRAILFSDNSFELKQNLFLSFNGKPSQANHNNLEVLDVNPFIPSPRQDIFKYFDIKFPSDEEAKSLTWEEAQTRIKVSDPNPSRCVACHGDPAKPIFQSYPIWKGAYGSFHMGFDPKESAELEKLIQTSRTSDSARYRHLIFDEDAGAMIPNNPADIISGSTNRMFNIALSIPNSQRVSRRIQQTKDYEFFAPALIAGSIGCESFKSFLPESMKLQIDENIERAMLLRDEYPENRQLEILRSFYDEGPDQFGNIFSMLPGGREGEYGSGDSMSWETFQQNQKAYWENWPVVYDLWVDTASRQGPHRSDPGVAKMRYLMEGRGIDISHWFMDIKQPTYRLSDGFNWSENIGWTLIWDDPSFEFIKNEISDEGRRTSFKGLACEKLKPLSLEKLSRFGQLEKLKRGSFKRVIEKGEFPKTFINTCAKCHTDQQIGPAIPFRDAAGFKTWFLSDGNSEKIKYRLTTENPLARMPLNRILEPEELQNILNYLEELK